MRNEGDPKILSTGPSSLTGSDRLGRALGWFSIALGAVELLAPRRIARALGMQGSENLLRAYGAREIGTGVVSLSVEKELGMWSRMAGDGVDLATLVSALHPENRKRGNVALAIGVVAGVALLDILAAQQLASRHHRRPDQWRRYSDRSGFPHGIEQARGAAKR
jgi:hypothetical protein